MLYLAYGSNLNVEQMGHRCPSAEKVGTAMIPGYRLMFKGSMTGAYLTIEPSADHEAPVGVWRVTGADIDALNIYEGYPRFYYQKQFILPCSDGKRHRAFAYIMHEDRMLGVPTYGYMRTCLQGYEDFGFDKKYLLEAVEYSKEVVA